MPLGASTVTNSGVFLPVWPKAIGFRQLEKSWFYNQCAHDSAWSGKEKKTQVRLTPGNGGSADFATALANRGPGTYVEFTSSSRPIYVIASVEGKVFRSGNKDSIKSAVTLELEQKSGEFSHMVNRRILSENGGALGRLPSSGSISGSTFYVRTKQQAMQFYAGMVLEASSDMGTGTAPTGKRVGSLTVSSVDVASRLITCTGAIATGIPAMTHSDYVWLQGEYGLMWSGLLSWVPPSAPSSLESFEGIDRTAYGDTERLSGYRPSSAALSADIADTIMAGISECAAKGIKPKDVVLSPKDWNTMRKQLGASVSYNQVASSLSPSVGFKAISLVTALGELNAIADPRMIEDYYIATDPKAWVIHSIGGLPNGSAGRGWAVEAGADAYQSRIIADGFVSPADTRDPGESIIGPLA